jgi:hypothetical protein
MKKNKNLIIIKEDKIKLLRKSHHNRYPLEKRLFTQLPSQPSDQIYLEISFGDLKYLLVGSLLTVETACVAPFVSAIHRELLQHPLKDELGLIQFKLEYQQAFAAVQLLIQVEEQNQKD